MKNQLIVIGMPANKATCSILNGSFHAKSMRLLSPWGWLILVNQKIAKLGHVAQ